MAVIPVKAQSAGIALAANRGVSAWWSPAAADAQLAEFTFDATALTAGDDAALTAVMQSLARASSARALHVALTSPWTSPRAVALPPMRRNEALAVLQRDATRHFPLTRGEPVVVARALSRRSWLACDADGVVLDAIARAARRAGFDAVTIVPAAAAWAHAASTAPDRAFIVDGEALLLSTHRGAITSLRRCRADDLPPTATVIHNALPVAARNAPFVSGLNLVSASQRAARDVLARRATRRLLFTSGCLLAAAVAMQAFGAQRRVTRMEARRAALHAAVTPLTAIRDSLTQAEDAVQAIARMQSGAPSWSARLLAVAQALPTDAYLVSVRADADSATVEGRAPDAAAVLERMRTARGVRTVRPLAAPIATDGTVAFAAVITFDAGHVR